MRISTLFYNVIIALNGYGMQKYIHLGKEKMRIFYLEAEISKKRILRFRRCFCIFRGTQDQNLPQDLIIKLQSLSVYQNDFQNVGQTSDASNRSQVLVQNLLIGYFVIK